MSEVISLREISSRSSDDALFEALKAGLRQHGRDKRIVAALESRASHSEDALAAAYVDPEATREEQNVAERDFALDMMALQPMVAGDASQHNPFQPAFMKFGRSRLAARMLLDPAARAIRKSVYFSPGATQRRFAASVSAAIRPYGDYDDRAFAAAVANGEFDTTD